MSPRRNRELAEAIVRTARALLEEGLVVGSLGNVSARDPSDPNVIHITPSGLSYAHMTPEDLAAIDLGGRVLQASAPFKPSSEWRLHVAIYRARPDAQAVVHTHSVSAQAWSFLGEPLPARSEELKLIAGGDVATARFAPSGTDELADRAVEALGERRAVLLACHGVVGVGESLEQAHTVCRIVERGARVAWLLRLGACGY